MTSGLAMSLAPLQQLILLLAALVLFLSFVLLAQNRLLSAIHAFAWQGALVAAVVTSQVVGPLAAILAAGMVTIWGTEKWA